MNYSTDIQTLQQKGWSILVPESEPDLWELVPWDIVGIITFVKESVCYIKKLEKNEDIEASSAGIKKMYLTYLWKNEGCVYMGAPIK